MQLCDQLRNDARRLSARWLRVIFQIADRTHYVRGRTQLQIACSILAALHQNHIGPPQDVFKEEPPTAIARIGTVRNPPVHDQQAAAGALGFTVQHRPNLGLKNHHQGGTNPRQHAPDGKSVIDRGIKDAIDQPVQSLFCYRAASHGSNRNIQRNARTVLSNFTQ